MSMRLNPLRPVAPVVIIFLAVMSLLSACSDTTSSSPAGITANLSSAPPSAAGTSASASTSTRLKVVATTTQLGDFVKNVGGNRSEVITLIKAGVDAHEFEPSAADSKALATAQLVFKNGLHLDDWLDKTITSSGTRAPVVNTSDGIIARKVGGEAAGAADESDPHIWFNTANARQMVDNIAAGLSKADPPGSNIYQTNARLYKEQLDEMVRQVKQEINTIPPANRKIVTNHDAFHYFLEEFGLTFVGAVIPSVDSSAEPSAKDIQELINKIKEQKVKAIFTETSINPKLAEQISKEAGVKIYSNLYGDSLGSPGSDGDTYIKMMLANARNIAAGLR